ECLGHSFLGQRGEEPEFSGGLGPFPPKPVDINAANCLRRIALRQAILQRLIVLQQGSHLLSRSANRLQRRRECETQIDTMSVWQAPDKPEQLGGHRRRAAYRQPSVL